MCFLLQACVTLVLHLFIEKLHQARGFAGKQYLVCLEHVNTRLEFVFSLCDFELKRVGGGGNIHCVFAWVEATKTY